jgi:hypothetical protein
MAVDVRKRQMRAAFIRLIVGLDDAQVSEVKKRRDAKSLSELWSLLGRKTKKRRQHWLIYTDY